MTFCDSLGITRLVCGQVRGGANDIGIWYSCKYRQDKQRYFGNNKVLFDSIYRHVERKPDHGHDELFLTRFPYAHTMGQALYNLFHYDARIMIENTYMRQQLYFPIIAHPFPYSKSLLDIVFRNVVTMTNVLIMHQSPMRQ